MGLLLDADNGVRDEDGVMVEVDLVCDYAISKEKEANRKF